MVRTNILRFPGPHPGPWAFSSCGHSASVAALLWHEGLLLLQQDHRHGQVQRRTCSTQHSGPMLCYAMGWKKSSPVPKARLSWAEPESSWGNTLTDSSGEQWEQRHLKLYTCPTPPVSSVGEGDTRAAVRGSGSCMQGAAEHYGIQKASHDAGSASCDKEGSKRPVSVQRSNVTSPRLSAQWHVDADPSGVCLLHGWLGQKSLIPEA